MMIIAWLFGKKMSTLLDYGAAVNVVAEEVIVGCINEARRKGMEANDPTYPIVQLERFHRQEKGGRDCKRACRGDRWRSGPTRGHCAEMAKMRC